MRNEQPDEFPEIYAFIRTAFETAAVKDGDEQDFISRLRDSENYLPRLAWVAHKQQELVGHLMLTRTDVKYADQPILRSLTVAALSVKLFYRNKGVGTALMEEGLRQAYTEGYSAIFLCGDPAYYYRFGFKPISSYGITNTGTVPPPYVLACELIPGILTGKEETGTVCF
ncbi:MAG: N-acetyltransferase [Bacteroides sp.]|nr:N-acetyltransferase [Bacteroides sp.]